MQNHLQKRLQCIREKWDGTFRPPTFTAPGVSQIELHGNHEAVVDGCQGILQYEDRVIRVSAGRLVVRFTGSDLTIRTMQCDQILICGTIAGVDFTS